jgi:hypothetical protein
MMKKVILCTVVSLFVFCGFVAGPWGADLAGAGAGAAVAATCSDLPNVEVCILIKKNGQIKPVAGKDIILRKPKEPGKPEVPQTDPPGTGKPKEVKDLPDPLKGKDEIKTAYKEHTIIIYGDDTCMRINGTYYCW